MEKTKKNSQGIAIACLLCNVLVIPGLGSIIAKRKEGVTQLIVFIIAIPLMFILIGFPLAFAMWVWGLVSGVNELNECE